MIRIWAVASTLLRELSRGSGFRVSVFFLLAIAALAPWLTGDADLLDRLRVLASYGIGLPVIFLSILALVYSANSLSQEMSRRYVHLLTTKPVSHTEILAGKLLGVVAACALLLAAVLVVFGVNLWLITSGEYSPQERERARQSFFTSRRGVTFEPRPVDEQKLRDIMARLEEEERVASLDPERDEEPGHGHAGHQHASHDVASAGHAGDDSSGGSIRRAQREERVRRTLQTWIVEPGREAQLRFRGLARPSDPEERLLIRYRFYSFPPNSFELAFHWRGRQGEYLAIEGEQLNVGVWRTLEIPAIEIDEEGELVLHVVNDEPLEAGIKLAIAAQSAEAMQGSDHFLVTLLKSFFVLLGQFAFLAAIGIFGAAFFSLPSAQLLCFFVYMTGLFSAYLIDSLKFVGDSGGLGTLLVWAGGAFLGSLPDFTGESPVQYFIEGRELSIDQLLWSLCRDVLLRGGILMTLTTFLWRRRDLGAIALS